MFSPRFPISAMIAAAALLLGACAAAPPAQLAARNCKVAVAESIGKPARNVTPAEQAEAELRMGRLATARRDYGIGNNLAGDVSRDCY